MDSKNEQYNEKSAYELARAADELLKQAECTMWGRPKEEDNFRQNQFNRKIKTGAFSRGGMSNRRNI